MTVTVAQLVAEIKITGAEQAKTEIQSVNTAAKETQSGFKGMLGSALSFAGGIGIANLAGQAFGFLRDQVVDSFKASMNVAQGMAQTVAVLKSTHDASGMTAQSVEDLAAKFSHLTDFSDITTESAENMLLTFTNIGKTVFPQATATVLDMAQALGQDTKNSAIQLGKALNDPIAGISALSRVGVTFDQNQKNLIATYMQHNQIAKAQGVILQELQREFGGSAVAAGKTFGGQLAIAGQYLEDVRRKIGDALIPVVQNLTSSILGSVLPALNQFSTWFASIGLPAIVHFASNAQNMTPILAGLGALLVSILIPAVYSLAAGAIAATWPFVAIGLAVGGLVAIFEHFSSTNAGFKSFIDGFVSGLSQAWTVISTNFLPTMQRLGSIIQTQVFPVLQQIGSWLLSVFAPVWTQLVQIWQGQLVPAWNQMMEALKPAMPAFQLVGMIIGGVLVVALGLLVGMLAGAARGFAALVSGLATALGGVVKIVTGVVTLIGGILGFLSDLVLGHFDKLGADLGHIWGGIVTMLGGAWDVIRGLFGAAVGAVWGIVSGFVEGVIHFFTHLWDTLVGHSIIPDMINGIVQWFASLPGRALAFVMQLVANLIAHFNALQAAATMIVQSLVARIISFFVQLPGQAVSAIQSLPGKLTSFFGGLAQQALNWGAHIIENIVSGITSKLSDVVAGAGKVASSIAGILAHTKPKAGPMADDDVWMEHFGDNLAHGLQQQVNKVRSAALNVALSVSSAVPGSPANRTGIPAGVAVASAVPASSPQVTVYVQQPDVNLDGTRVARKLMPHIVATIRTATGVRHT